MTVTGYADLQIVWSRIAKQQHRPSLTGIKYCSGNTGSTYIVIHLYYKSQLENVGIYYVNNINLLTVFFFFSVRAEGKLKGIR